MIQPSPIDQNVIDALRSMDTDADSVFLRELIELYVVDTPPKLAALRFHIEAQEWVDARQIAHFVKGSSANLGAHEVRNLASQLERDIYMGKFEQLIAQCAAIEASFARAASALRKIA